MYTGHACLFVYVCLSVPCHIPTLLHGPRCVTWGNGRGFPLVVHYWADLQSVYGFSCYDNIVPNAKCQRVLVVALFLVLTVVLKLKDCSKSEAVTDDAKLAIFQEWCESETFLILIGSNVWPTK